MFGCVRLFVPCLQAAVDSFKKGLKLDENSGPLKEGLAMAQAAEEKDRERRWAEAAREKEQEEHRKRLQAETKERLKAG